MALKPETATRLRDGVREEVFIINTLRPGDIIEVAAGGGKLVSSFASTMKARSPAKSIPVGAQRYDFKVPAGATSVDRLVTTEVIRTAPARLTVILTLIEEAEERRAPT